MRSLFAIPCQPAGWRKHHSSVNLKQNTLYHKAAPKSLLIPPQNKQAKKLLLIPKDSLYTSYYYKHDICLNTE